MDVDAHFTVVVVGGGAAGIAVARRLRRGGLADLAVIDPSTAHHHQALWTLVGTGRATLAHAAQSMAEVVPEGTTWVNGAVVAVNPEEDQVVLADGRRIGYQVLVMSPGLQLNWRQVSGLVDALADQRVCSVYHPELAPGTWADLSGLESGRAVFCVPSGPVKSPGTGQSIAYLACAAWRRLRRDVDVHLVLPGGDPFWHPRCADILDRAARRWGITVHLGSEITTVDRRAGTVSVRNPEGFESLLPYDLLHLVPHQSAPDWVATSALATGQGMGGFIDVDPHTLRHPDYPAVFALGDAAGLSTAKTANAARRQAAVVASNVQAVLAGGSPPARYDGYSRTPVRTGDNRVLLAEMSYSGTVRRPVPGWPWALPDPGLAFTRLGLWCCRRRTRVGRSGQRGPLGRHNRSWPPR